MKIYVIEQYYGQHARRIRYYNTYGQFINAHRTLSQNPNFKLACYDGTLMRLSDADMVAKTRMYDAEKKEKERRRTLGNLAGPGVFKLRSINITHLGGPMGTEYTYDNWVKYFSTVEKAQAYAVQDYKKPLEWTKDDMNRLRTRDLGHVQYHIERVIPEE